jgi:hypothetical protein
MSETLDIMGMDEIEIENTSVDDIDNESVNLIFVGIDESGSMSPYINDMKKCLTDFKDALSNSKEVDEILIARADFESNINIGGYKKVSEFDSVYDAYCMTALYDVIVEGTDKLKNYMTYLKNQGMRVKAVFAIFSDGEDTCSKKAASQAKNSIKSLNEEEIVTAFISFGGSSAGIAKALEFKNILPVGSSASELRKAFNCLSKSVIESSKTVVNKTDDFFTM